MALTITNKPIQFQGGLGMVGGLRFRISTITFDLSYPTGGEAVTASDFDLPTAIIGLAQIAITDGGGVTSHVHYDAEAGTLIAMALDDGAQEGNATDLSGTQIKALVIGY